MFNELLALIQKEVVYAIYKVSLGLKAAPSVMQNRKMVLKGSEAAFAKQNANDPDTAKVAGIAREKVGRNEPCPCGSGKKYKKCHGKDE